MDRRIHQREPQPPSPPICVDATGRPLSTLRFVERNGPPSPYSYVSSYSSGRHDPFFLPLPPESRPPVKREENHLLLPDNRHARYLLEPVERRSIERLLEQRRLPPHHYSNRPDTRVHGNHGSCDGVFFDSSHNPTNARVSDRIVYPDGRPETRRSMCGVVGGDDNLVVRDRNLMRGFPLGRYPVLVEDRANEINGWKRRRLEQQVDEDDCLKKEGFLGDCRAGIHLQDPPFERKPSGGSSFNLLNSGCFYERPVFDEALISRGRHQHLPYPVDQPLNSEMRSSSSGMYNTGSSNNVWEKRLDRNTLFSKDWDDAEVVGTRKPSVLSRIEYAKPVWKRVDEKRPAPWSSSAVYGPGGKDNTTNIKVDFTSNTLMPNEVTSSQELLYNNVTKGRRRIAKKESSRNKRNKKTSSGVATVILHKSTTKNNYVSMKNSKGRTVSLQTSKKVRTSDSLRYTPVKCNRNSKRLGILKEDAVGIGISVPNDKSSSPLFTQKVKTNNSVSTFPDSILVTSAGTITIEEGEGTYNACLLASSRLVSSHFTSKDEVANEAPVICHDCNTESDANVIATGISPNRVTNETAVSVSPSSYGNCKIARIADHNVVKKVSVSSPVEKLSYGDRTAICPAEEEEVAEVTHKEYDAILHSDRNHSGSGRAKEKMNKSVVFYHKEERVLETGDECRAVVSTPHLRGSEGETTQKTFDLPCTCYPGTVAEITQGQHCMDQACKENSTSNCTCYPNTGEATLMLKCHTMKMQEETLDPDLAHSDREIAIDGTFKEIRYQERTPKQTAVISGEIMSEVPDKIEGLYKDFMLDSINKVNTVEASLKKAGEQIVVPSTSSPEVGQFGNDEVVKNSVFSPSYRNNSNKDPASSLRIPRKRKRKNKSEAGNLLPKLALTDEKCKLEAPCMRSKDSILLEEAHMMPHGKKRKKKKLNLCTPSEPLFLCSSLPTLQNASQNGKEPHSCKDQNHLDEVCDHIALENCQMFPPPLSLEKGKSYLESDNTLISDTAHRNMHNVRSLNPKISNLNSPGKTAEVVLAKTVTLCPKIESDGYCRSFEYPRKENCTLQWESSRDSSKSPYRVQMPLLGDNREFVPPIEITNVFSAGGSTNGDIIEERGRIEVRTLLEADSMKNLIEGCCSGITETGYTTSNFDFLEKSLKDIKQGESLREQDKTSETQVSCVVGCSSAALEREHHGQHLQLIDTMSHSNNMKHEKGQSYVSPKSKLEQDIPEKIALLNDTLSSEVIGGEIDGPIQCSLPNPIKRSVFEPHQEMQLDKTAAGYHLLHEKRMLHLSQEAKKHIGDSSKVVAKEGSNPIKDRQKSKLAFPHRSNFSSRPLQKVAPVPNVKHRIWRRAETCPSLLTPQQPQMKLSSLSSSQRSSANKSGNLCGSYVRKGNSLIRKSSTATAPGESPHLHTSCQAHRIDNLESRSGHASVACSKVEGTSSFVDGSKPLAILRGSNSGSCIRKSLGCDDILLENSCLLESGVEGETVLSESKKSDLCSPECCVESKKINSKPMIYVRHNSNQLVASGIGIGKSSAQVSKRARALTSTLSDGSFILKRNALAAKEKKFKEPRFSLVWRLGVKSENQEVHSISNIFPSIFPWKRATCWKSLINRTLTKRPVALISSNLQFFRKRNTVYTVSKGGFSLRKSGVLSIGRSNLKWTKSIEKRSKQANEEATLAVAEADRKRREQKGSCHLRMGTKKRDRLSKACVFRVGTIRYKMDSSKRTLIRLPDLKSPSPTNCQPGLKKQTLFSPRRLLIGHEEYVRVGNGNQLVRDPKKLVRILASEKIRWSLHTARLRLAKKKQYCQFFTRFGKCKKEGGKCPYIHDPTKVAICTKFINGLCSGGDCRLTHQVIPERMPDCSYFLQGLCTNISCPYRHVKVNSKTSICEGFLKGYCSDGDECRKKHSYVCPNFEATGKCLDGSACKLHHPKSINKFKVREKNEGIVYRRKRYFIGQPSECDSKPKTDEKGGEEDISLCEEPRFSEYISLDSTDDSQPTDGHLFDNWSDVDALIKPLLIMSGSK